GGGRRPSRPGVLEQPAERRRIVGVDDVDGAPADDLLRRDAEDGGDRRARVPDRAAAVDDRDHVARALDERPEVLLAAAEIADERGSLEGGGSDRAEEGALVGDLRREAVRADEVGVDETADRPVAADERDG